MSTLNFIERYEKAIESQDWSKVGPMVHDNCVVTFTNGTYKGKAEVEGIFKKNFELINDEEYAITNVHVVNEASNYAVFIFNYNWSGMINGKPAQGGGRGTSVIVNCNGSWQLLSEHLGPNA